MATKRDFTSGGVIPEGFTPPFKRVQMEERIDDALACIATLTGRTLAEVNKLAIQLGFPQFGPAWVDHALISKLLQNLGFAAGEYQDVPSLAALPDVAILMVDYQPALDSGRCVVWHHVRGSAEQAAFSYVIDVASWVKPEQRVTSDFRHMRMDPAWFIEVKPKTTGKSK